MQVRISDVKADIKLVRHAAEEDKGLRPILQCVHVETKGNHTHFVAADGFQIAYTKKGSIVEGFDGNYSLYSPEMKAILRMSNKAAWETMLPELPKTEGTFPNWETFVPNTEGATLITVDGRDLMLVSKALLESSCARFVLNGGVFSISGELASDIPFEINLPVKNKGVKGVRFAMRPKYIYDMCHALPLDCVYDIDMYVCSSTSPILFRHLLMEKVIMPMDVRWEQ